MLKWTYLPSNQQTGTKVHREFRDIYSGHFPPPRGRGIFVQIKTQGRIWRRTSWKRKGKREKRRKKKSDKTHFKNTFMMLKWPQKNPQKKTGKNFWGGEGIFPAGQNIYPCVSLSELVIITRPWLFQRWSMAVFCKFVWPSYYLWL